MTREGHARFWERLGVKLPWATRQSAHAGYLIITAEVPQIADGTAAVRRTGVQCHMQTFGCRPSPRPCVDAVDLEHVLGEINPDRANLHVDGPLM